MCEGDDLSACDYEGEFADKFDIINERRKPKTGIFESSPYFEKLFPSHKIQKPGTDYYGRTTLFLAILALYVFSYYGQMAVDQDNYLDNSNNNIFKGDMVICLIVVIAVIIIERYVSRSDTKSVNKNASLTGDEDARFFSSETFFRQGTSRSMTVKL